MKRKTTFIFYCLLCTLYTFISFFTLQAKQEKAIVVIIASYNNKIWHKKNLDSVFNQNYKNYRIIYINDASTDKTGELVKAYVKKCKQAHRTIIINNKKNIGAMANYYKAIHMCQDREIIIQLDGDDWLKHKNVLKRVNNEYQNENIWLTYGQYEHLFYDKDIKKACVIKGRCEPIIKDIIKHNAHRETIWVTSSLRTFYAGLFKKIKLKDFLCDGKFFDTSCDLGIMYPLLEMSKNKFKYIDEILYVYNTITNLSDNKLRPQRKAYLNKFIRSRKKYQPLKEGNLPFKNRKKNVKADIIIISENNPQYLLQQIKSICCYTNGIDKIYALYKSQDKNKNQLYKKIKRSFSDDVVLIKYNHNTFKNTLEKTITKTNNKHIILSTDNILIKDFVDIQKCIKLLKQTYAHAFYLSLGCNITKNKNILTEQHIPIHTELNNFYFWQFKMGQYEWRKANNLNMTLYKKKDVLKNIKNINYNNPKELIKTWNLQKFDLNNIGLFFKESKAVAINMPSINIAKLFLIKNNTTIITNKTINYDRIKS